MDSAKEQSGTLFSQLLRGIREKFTEGQTLSGLAELAGIQRSYLHKLETGAIRIPKDDDAVRKLADAINTCRKSTQIKLAPYGEVLWHAYEVVSQDLLTIGDPNIIVSKIADLFFSFGFAQVLTNQSCTLSREFINSLDQLPHGELLISQDHLKRIKLLDDDTHRVRGFPGALLHRIPELRTLPRFNEFMIIGKLLVIVNFASYPCYITAPGLVITFSDLYRGLSQADAVLRLDGVGDLLSEYTD